MCSNNIQYGGKFKNYCLQDYFEEKKRIYLLLFFYYSFRTKEQIEIEENITLILKLFAVILQILIPGKNVLILATISLCIIIIIIIHICWVILN